MTNRKTEEPRDSVKPTEGSPMILTSRRVSTAKGDELRDALRSKPMSAADVTLKVNSFEALGYFVEQMTDYQREQRLTMFVRALKFTPAAFALGAFEDWFTRERRAPSPADIGKTAEGLITRARQMIEWQGPPKVSPPFPKLTDAELAERRRLADRLMIEAGFKREGAGHGEA